MGDPQYWFALTGGSLTKLAYYSTVQHKVAKVRSFEHTTKVSFFLKIYLNWHLYTRSMLFVYEYIEILLNLCVRHNKTDRYFMIKEVSLCYWNALSRITSAQSKIYWEQGLKFLNLPVRFCFMELIKNSETNASDEKEASTHKKIKTDNAMVLKYYIAS